MGKYLRKPEKRRPNVFLRILMGLLTLAVSAVSIVVTVGVLLSMAQNMGDPGNAAQSSGGSAAIMDNMTFAGTGSSGTSGTVPE